MWVDNKYLGYTGGADGSWRNMGLENVSYFNDRSLFFNDYFGSRLLDNEFFARQMQALGSDELRGALFAARVREGIGVYGTQTALIAISIPLAAIAASEIAGSMLLEKSYTLIGRGKNFRIDFDWRKGLHYHRRVKLPKGTTKPGQGIGRHRPWDSKSTDRTFWDRW